MYNLNQLFNDYTKTEEYRTYQPASEKQRLVSERILKLAGEELFIKEIEPMITDDESECELQGFIHGFRLAVDLLTRK